MSDTADELSGQRRLLAEIDEELRRRRAAGDLPPSLDRKLDEVFDRLAPGGSLSTGHDPSIDQVEQAAYIDIEAPAASNLVVGELPKRAVRRLVSWYFGYVVQQVTAFTTATSKALYRLDRRLSDLEQDRETGRDLLESADVPRAMEPTDWTDFVTERMSGLSGRVLHTECGDGTLLRALLDSGVDVYGVDSRVDLLDSAARTGASVLAAESLDHLRGLTDASLGGLVLSRVVDRLGLGAQTEMIRHAGRTLRAGGVLVLLSVDPAAWGRSVSVVEADLSPGRPLHADTWVHLLERNGFSSVEIDRGRRAGGLNQVTGSGPAWEATRQAWDAVSSNLARLDELLFPSPSFAVTGVLRG